MKRKGAGKAARGAPRGRPAGDYADPYQRVRRPRPAAAADSPPRERWPASGQPRAVSPGRERRPPRREPGEGFGSRERSGREGGGFTVTLDPDVAKVFRGDASVNKALRLVMQLMQVVQGPPRGAGPNPRAAGERRGGYQGSAEARGFTPRKPRFEEDDEQ